MNMGELPLPILFTILGLGCLFYALGSGDFLVRLRGGSSQSPTISSTSSRRSEIIIGIIGILLLLFGAYLGYLDIISSTSNTTGAANPNTIVNTSAPPGTDTFTASVPTLSVTAIPELTTTLESSSLTPMATATTTATPKLTDTPTPIPTTLPTLELPTSAVTATITPTPQPSDIPPVIPAPIVEITIPRNTSEFKLAHFDLQIDRNGEKNYRAIFEVKGTSANVPSNFRVYIAATDEQKQQWYIYDTWPGSLPSDWNAPEVWVGYYKQKKGRPIYIVAILAEPAQVNRFMRSDGTRPVNALEEVNPAVISPEIELIVGHVNGEIP